MIPFSHNKKFKVVIGILFFYLIYTCQVFSQNDIFISELSVSATESAIELFNPTDSAIDLTGYSIRMAINQSKFPTLDTLGRFFSFYGHILGPLQTFVIVNKDVPQEAKINADVILSDKLDIAGDYILHLYQGNDAIALFKGDQIIDIVGKAESNVLWDIAGVTDATWGNTLIRKPMVQKGNPDWDNVRGFIDEATGTVADSSEWIVLPGITFNFLGSHPNDLWTQKDVFISEITFSGLESAIELYNPTDTAIDLTGYSLRMAINESAFPSSSLNARFLSLTGHILEPLQTFVIVNKGVHSESYEFANLILSDNNQVAGEYILHLFEGNDAIALYKDNLLIDIIGKATSNQMWDIAGVMDATRGHTLIRKPLVQNGNPDWDNVRGFIDEATGTQSDSSEWIVLPSITYANLKSHDHLKPNSAGIIVNHYGIRMINRLSNINYGLLNIDESREILIRISNYGDIDLVIENIQSDSPEFVVSKQSFNIKPGIIDTFIVTCTVNTDGITFGKLLIISNDHAIDTFQINLIAYGTNGSKSDTTHFYVSPLGNDDNNGDSKDMPLKTLNSVIEKVRELNRPPQFQMPLALTAQDNPITGIPANYLESIEAHSKKLTLPVEIHLLPGYYFLDTTLIIDETVGGNIHFRGEWAEGTENEIQSKFETNGLDPQWLDLPSDKLPIISGGEIISNWTETTVNGHEAWVAFLPSVASGQWYFRQLFVNGRRAVRSRWPKKGTFRITEILPRSTGEINLITDRVRLRNGDMIFSKNIEDIEWVGLHRWVDDRIPIKSWNTGENELTLNYLPKADMNSSHPTHKGGLCPYYFDHVIETMSEPGEWYLDRIEGKLYYIPRSGEKFENTEIIAPRIASLINIRGNSEVNSFIWNITFQRIGFMHTLTDPYKHLSNDPSSNLSGSGNGIISFSSSRMAGVTACFFGHIGEPGIEFGNGTMGGEISSCTFRDLGSSAIQNFMSGTFVDHTDRNGFNNIHDNDILGFGRFYESGVAIINLNVIYTLIEHNLIRDGYYSGLTCVMTGETEFKAYYNTIRKNHIFKIGQGLLSDMGGIYTSWHQVGTVIEENLVHNIEARDYGGSALYLDKNSSYIITRKNIFYHTNEDIINMKGHSHIFHNNLLAFSSNAAIFRQFSAEPSVKDALNLGEKPAELMHNILIQNGGRMFQGVESGGDIQYQVTSDNNIFYNYNGSVQMNLNQSLNQWQTFSGDDLHSLTTNPLLADPLRFNFKFNSGSVAETMGFLEIDPSDIGTRKSVWDEAGAVWIKTPAEINPVFLPSVIIGLHFWITAKDLDSDNVSKNKVFKWEDRTFNKFNFFQYDEKYQPAISDQGLNGNPVVKFNGESWMSSMDKSAEVQGRFGTFGKENFTLITVHRSNEGQQVVLCKGKEEQAGNWSIGLQQNQFGWGDTNFIGSPGNDFKVRIYERKQNRMDYYENGKLTDSMLFITNPDFSNEIDHFYLGRQGSEVSGMLDGEIAEIIVYKRNLNKIEKDEINTYLFSEWGIDTTSSSSVRISNVPQNNLEFFPNPCNDHLYIEGNEDVQSIVIYNLAGETILNFGFNKVGTQWIPVQKLEPGIYILEAKITGGGRRFGKLIKNKN